MAHDSPRAFLGAAAGGQSLFGPSDLRDRSDLAGDGGSSALAAAPEPRDRWFSTARLKAHAQNWMFRRVISPFFRRFRPIVVIPPGVQRLGLQIARQLGIGHGYVPADIRPLALVWRYDDVAEVLGDHERFNVEGYDEKMRECSNPFLLGMGFTPEYKADIALLRSVMRPEDRDTIHAIAERHSLAGVASVTDKRIDVVQQLVAPVVAGFVRDYLGVPAPTSMPPPDDVLPFLHLFLDTASYMFNLDIVSGYPKSRFAAISAGQAISAHIASLIAVKRRTTPRHPGTTVLDRLLATPGVSDGLAKTIIGGTVSGAIAVTFSQCLWVIDRFLDLPARQLAELQDVARSGDEALLGRYVREASRFKPFPPGLLRRCNDAQTVARSTPRARTLPARSVVVALTWSAALDPDRVDDPLRFHPGRDDGAYLLFGTGQHHCVAAQPERPIAQTLMTQMVKALLVKHGLRRAPGAAGFIQGDHSTGRWPEHFFLEFD